MDDGGGRSGKTPWSGVTNTGSEERKQPSLNKELSAEVLKKGVHKKNHVDLVLKYFLKILLKK